MTHANLHLAASFAGLLTLVIATAQASEPAEENGSRIHGELLVFAIDHDNPFYNDDFGASFVETTLKVRTYFDLSENATFNLGGAFGAVGGNSIDLIHVRNETEALLDLWNLELDQLFGGPLKLTLGRQDFKFGDGFVVWDGALDQATVWTAEIHSMTGARIDYRGDGYKATLFSSRTNRDHFLLDGFLGVHEGQSSLHGFHLSLEENGYGAWELGIFGRNDQSALDSDTIAVSLRGTYEPTEHPRWSFGGEYVKETGEVKLLDGLPSATRQDRDAWAGHLDATYRFGDSPTAPYVKASRIQFSGDDPTTTDYEGYDPMFFGWVDWGKWYVGSISSWEVFSTNERVSLFEVGGFARPNVKLRAQLFDFNLHREWIPGAGKQWSREVNLVLDWIYTKDRVFGAALNYARPQHAAEAFIGDNDSRVEAMVWMVLLF